MKAKCLISHRIMLDNGGFRDYTAGEVYDLPNNYEAGPYFEPVKEETKKSKKGVMSDG